MLSIRGQHIVTHDAIIDIMYALVKKSGHIVWKKWWYAFMSKVSLQTYLYMIHEDQVFVINVVVTILIGEMVVASVIS